MYKILVISDVHGRLRDLRWVLQNETADAMFYLGDGLYDLNAALELRREPVPYPIYRVAGNCDVNYSEPSEGLAPFGGVLFFYTHGHHYGVKMGSERLAECAGERGADVALFGHTHRRELVRGVGTAATVFNPGSLAAGGGRGAGRGLPPPKGGCTVNETQRRRALADVKEFFLRAGALAALLLVLFGVVFGLAVQPDDTMYPHLKPGDLLLYYRLPRSFAVGEVVVFTQDDRRCTGRVAARGGDTVEVTENALLRINGSLVAEPDIYETTPRYDSDVTYPLTLADGEYFILCDAREGAPDSRRYGPVTAENIAGRVIAIVRRNEI